MLQIGSIVDGKYRVLDKLGQGGMSVVYLVRNERANKQWAIKEVRKDGKQNYEVVKQGLIAETDMLKKLNHPHLPSIIDVIDMDDTFLIVMDYIPGRPLNVILREEGAQPQERVIKWAKQLCDVLGYLHAQNPPIIYRDMKPPNVMLRDEETDDVTLIDFGTAREYKYSSAADDTTTLGTPGYAAPEQYGGRGQTDARTDIYCLGATMFHLLTGCHPNEVYDQYYAIRRWKPSLSSGLEEIILKCTAPNPGDRYQNCGELMYALEHYSELDIEYKKKQGRKWAAFLTTSILAVVTGVGAAGFRALESHTKSSTYQAYIKDAEMMAATDPEMCEEYYKNAININPAEGEAYQKLLNFFLWESNEGSSECNFSPEEEQAIRNVLGEIGNTNRSNKEYLEANTKAYESFAFELGKAYFYSYDKTGNKTAARNWLEIAADAEPSEELSELDIKKAKNLFKISDYYDSLGVRNKAGDSKVSYSDYWLDLVSMVQDEAENVDNNVSALLVYKEVSSLIATKTAEFKNAGITRTQLEDEIQLLRERLGRIQIEAGGANADYEQELKSIAEENLNIGQKNIPAVFNTENISER